MQRRNIFIVLFIAALLGIGAVVWFILKPVLPSLPTNTTKQPPALPAEIPFDPTKSGLKAATTTAVSIDLNSPQEKERQAEEAIKRLANDFAARQGTYSSSDNFESLRAITASVTPTLKTKLDSRLAQLRADHPAFGDSWTQSIRVLSTELDNASIPLIGRADAKVTIQAQQVTTVKTVDQAATVVLTVLFVKQGDKWIPSDVSLQPYNP
ncbi:MAG: hypothetical protein WCK01_02860 [Candidatus Uhrbacteria bacterium]